jgi:hypothetical protein
VCFSTFMCKLKTSGSKELMVLSPFHSRTGPSNLYPKLRNSIKDTETAMIIRGSNQRFSD